MILAIVALFAFAAGYSLGVAKLNSWSLSDWMTALVGEVGEAANIVKKLNRVRDGIPGNTESETALHLKLYDEVADIAIYLDLFAQALGIDLEEIREAKFRATSKKIGYIEDMDNVGDNLD